MTLKLYAHPFSSYCQKVLIAFYENQIPFDLRLLDPQDSAVGEELATLWPLKKFPVLVDGGRTIPESSIIIEYLQISHPGPVDLIPKDPAAAIDVRLMDRFFDNYVMSPTMRIVFNTLRDEADKDPAGVTEAKSMLQTAYEWLDRYMKDRNWASGESFSLADCAAAPALFYADWVFELSPDLHNLRAYRARLLGRPSFARAVDEARPYRGLFPLGAPDRD